MFVMSCKCLYAAVGDTQDKQPIIEWYSHPSHSNNSKERYSGITERSSNRKALQIINYSVLSLLLRSCASCTTRVLKVFSIISEDTSTNFPLNPVYFNYASL